MLEIGFIILGLAAGILSGIFGVGGGIVIVPSLIVFFGMDILDANATSLASMLLPVRILGVWEYYKAGLLHVKESLWLALGLFLGSFVGGEIAVNISEDLLAKLYVVILIYIALTYFDLPSLFKKKKIQIAEPTERKKRSMVAFVIVGIGAGVFAGLFGKGGGIVIVPLLIAIFHYDAKAAAATSLAALLLPVGLPSVIIYANEGHLQIFNAALIAIGILVGTLIGSKIGIKLSSSIFKKMYAAFLVIVAIFMLTRYI